MPVAERQATREGSTTTVLEQDVWRLSDSVALRPEEFGALAYDFSTRRLSFLKTPTLVEVVRGLDETRTVGEALTAAGVSAEKRASYLLALAGLASGGLLKECSR